MTLDEHAAESSSKVRLLVGVVSGVESTDSSSEELDISSALRFLPCKLVEDQLDEVLSVGWSFVLVI